MNGIKLLRVFAVILLMSIEYVAIWHFSNIYNVCSFSLYFLKRLIMGLSILLVFSKNQLWFLEFSLFFFFISLISSLRYFLCLLFCFFSCFSNFLNNFISFFLFNIKTFKTTNFSLSINFDMLLFSLETPQNLKCFFIVIMLGIFFNFLCESLINTLVM